MKNSADLGGCYPPRSSASADNTLLDLQNSSYPTKAKFNNCFIVNSKYFPIFTEEFCHFALCFSAHQNNTSLSPGFLNQRFNNLRRDALLTSFWRHRFNNLHQAALLTSLVQYFVIAAGCEEFCRSRRVLSKYRRHTDPNAGYDQN